jgi:hypothetical protein
MTLRSAIDAPKHLHDQIRADFKDMTHARTPGPLPRSWQAQGVPGQVATALPAGRDELGRSRRPAVHLRHHRALPARAVALVEDHQAIERLHEKFKRRIKTQCVLPCAETAAMLFWALLASGQITMRRVDCWQTLQRSPAGLDLAA